MILFPQPFLHQPSVVAIGNFDGVHAGHKALLALAKAEAEQLGLPLVVLTFEPHPRTVLWPEMPLVRLTNIQEKKHRLQAVGVDVMAVLGFDEDVASWGPQKFIDDVLVAWLGAQVVVVGANFRFGAKAAGDTNTLQAQTTFTTMVMPLLTDAGGVISSRRLRDTRAKGLTS